MSTNLRIGEGGVGQPALPGAGRDGTDRGPGPRLGPAGGGGQKPASAGPPRCSVPAAREEETAGRAGRSGARSCRSPAPWRRPPRPRRSPGPRCCRCCCCSPRCSPPPQVGSTRGRHWHGRVGAPRGAAPVAAPRLCRSSAPARSRSPVTARGAAGGRPRAERPSGRRGERNALRSLGPAGRIFGQRARLGALPRPSGSRCVTDGAPKVRAADPLQPSPGGARSSAAPSAPRSRFSPSSRAPSAARGGCRGS